MAARTAIPERVRFAVDLLDPLPADRILEIGSGPGVAGVLICERLAAGRLLAVDRSAVATQRTADRGAEHVAAGRLEVRTVALDALRVPDASLDKAFSINVNLFWTRSPAPELAVLRAALRPGGVVHICYGAAGPQTPERVTAPISTALVEHGFTDVSVRNDEGGIAVSGRVPR